MDWDKIYRELSKFDVFTRSETSLLREVIKGLLEYDRQLRAELDERYSACWHVHGPDMDPACYRTTTNVTGSCSTPEDARQEQMVEESLKSEVCECVCTLWIRHLLERWPTPRFCCYCGKLLKGGG